MALWKRRHRLEHLRVRMYKRKGCHLCKEAWQALAEAQRTWGFTLDAVDIDGDPELVKLHGEWVPVVTVNDKVRFRGKVNPVLLRRLLDSEHDS